MSTSPALDARITDIAGRLGEYATRISEVEKYVARGRHANDNTPAANDNLLAAAISASDDVRRLNSSFRGKTVVRLTEDRAALTSANTTVGAGRSASTSLIQADRLPGILQPYERELTIRDLIGNARTTSNAVEYAKETSFTDAAAPVAETTDKPYSDLTFDMVSSPVRTLAHLFKISRQILDDAPALADYIGRRGTYGLKRLEENQVLFGSGTGQNLNGVVPQATAFETGRVGPTDTRLDWINHAIAQAEEDEFPTTGIVLSRADWRKMIATKDAGGNYISGNSPFGLTAPALWNLPVLATNAMPAGQFAVGPWREAITIYDRLEVELLISTENDRDFELNLATVRIEERVALVNQRPAAFIVGAFA